MWHGRLLGFVNLDQFYFRYRSEVHKMLIRGSHTQVSAFYYGEKEAPNYLVRFCYCKSRSKLERACDQMAAYFEARVTQG